MASGCADTGDGGRVKQSSVLLRLKVDVRYITTGESGIRYEFVGAGNVQSVNEEDVEKLLSKQTARGCCMGIPQQPIFELVE